MRRSRRRDCGAFRLDDLDGSFVCFVNPAKPLRGCWACLRGLCERGEAAFVVSVAQFNPPELLTATIVSTTSRPASTSSTIFQMLNGYLPAILPVKPLTST